MQFGAMFEILYNLNTISLILLVMMLSIPITGSLSLI